MDWADKPFHESVVDAIAAAITHDDFAMLARMIMSTKIPKNHKVIIEAWRASSIEAGHEDHMIVIACLLGKKEQAVIEAEKDEVQIGSITVIVD